MAAGKGADNGAILYSELFNDDGGLDKLIEALTQINTAYANLHANVKTKAGDLKKSTEDLSGATSLQREEITKLLNESQKLKSVESELIEVKKKYQSILDKAKKTREEELELNKKALQVYSQVTGADINAIKSKNELNTVRRNGLNYLAQETDSYAQLAAKANLITLALNKMTVEQRNNSVQGKALTAQAKEYTEVLKVQDASVGRHQRNVGDYGKATARLNFATAQIVRELPVAAMRADMFFLAISNNIPMLADQVTNMKNMNKELIANGKAMEVVSVPKALLKSFLSFNTIMMVAVTLLTMFGGKIVNWIGSLMKGKDSLVGFNGEINKTSDAFSKLNEEANKTAGATIAQTDALLASWSKLKTLEEKQQYIINYKDKWKELGVTITSVSDMEKLANSPESVKVVKEALIQKALAQAAYTQMVELQTEKLNINAKKEQLLREKSLTGWKWWWYQLRDGFLGLVSWVTNPMIDIFNGIMKGFYWLSDKTDEILGNPKATGKRVFLERYSPVSQKEEYNSYIKDYEKQTDDLDKQIKAINAKYNTVDGTKSKAPKTPKAPKSAKEEKDYSKEVIDSQNKLNEDLAKNQEDSLNKQLEINRTAIEKEILEANAKANEALDILDQESKGKIKLTEKQKDDLEKIANNLTDDQKAIIEKGGIEQQKIRDDFNKKSLDQFNKYTEEHWKETQDQANKELDANLLAVDEKYNIQVEDAQDSIKIQKELNKELLKIEIARIKEKMDINLASNEYDAKLQESLTRQKLRAEKKLAGLSSGGGLSDVIKKVFKLTDEQFETIANNLSTTIDSIKSSLGELLQAYVDFYDAKIDKQQENVDQAQSLVDSEREAKANGYASNVSAAEASLATEQAALEKSQAEKEKYVKMQEDLDAAMQISSLITATAQILASYASIPFIGQVLAIAGIAGMWGTFIAAKATAAQVTSYGEGGYGVLEGGSHASGNDILLGTTKDGTQLRAEGDEGYGVINRRMTRKYAKILPDVFKSINNGIFEQKYLSSYKGQEMNVINANYTDTSRMEKGINKLISQNEVKTFIDGKGRTVIIKGNTTRIIS